MRKVKKQVNLPEGKRTLSVGKVESKDLANARQAYRAWKDLSKKCKALGSRGVNMPEGISETVVCHKLGLVKKLNGTNANNASTSWDAFDLKTNKRVQIKSCSVEKDLTSFGPRSKFDDFYFVDFYNNGQLNGKYQIYHIPATMLKKLKVNKSQNLGQVQKKGLRPRLSIKKAIIDVYNLKPVAEGRL